MNTNNTKPPRAGSVRIAILHQPPDMESGTYVLVVRKAGRVITTDDGEEKELPELCGLIGGGYEPGEDPYDAAEREIREESGLDGADIEENPRVTDLRDPRKPVYLYFATNPVGRIRVDDPEGMIRQCRWIPAQVFLNAEKLLGVPVKKSHQRMFRQALKQTEEEKTTEPLLYLRLLDGRGRILLRCDGRYWRLPAAVLEAHVPTSLLCQRLLDETRLDASAVLFEGEPYATTATEHRGLDCHAPNAVQDAFLANTSPWDEEGSRLRWLSRETIEAGWHENLKILEKDIEMILEPPAGSRMPS